MHFLKEEELIALIELGGDRECNPIKLKELLAQEGIQNDIPRLCMVLEELNKEQQRIYELHMENEALPYICITLLSVVREGNGSLHDWGTSVIGDGQTLATLIIEAMESVPNLSELLRAALSFTEAEKGNPYYQELLLGRYNIPETVASAISNIGTEEAGGGTVNMRRLADEVRIAISQKEREVYPGMADFVTNLITTKAVELATKSKIAKA